MTLSDYVAAVLRRARIDHLSDGSYFGRVPGFPSIAARGATPDDCRAELETLLQQEVQQQLQQGMVLPTFQADSPTDDRQ
jgi:predicted RNase H-like HicB family nuclease